MPRKVTLESMEAKFERAAKKKASMKAEMATADKELREIETAIAAEKKRIRNENLIKLGKIICRYYGEDMTAERLEEFLKKERGAPVEDEQKVQEPDVHVRGMVEDS